ncbi:MAG: BON domain-containing protein [Dokdonella sp.]
MISISTKRSLLVLAIAAAMAFALPACTSNPNKTGAERTGEVVGNAAEKTGDAVGNAADKTGEVVSDSWITTKVKSQLIADDLVKARDINVSTDQGIVTLAGVLESNAERSRAMSITKGTKGVKGVNTSALKVN